MKSMLIQFPLGHLANDWAPGAIWLLAPAIAMSMGLTPYETGLLLTIHSAGAAMGYLPAGILADRVGNPGKLLAATFWWVAIGYFIASYAPEYWSLAILLAVAGLGDAAWHPIATGVLVNHMPHRRGMILGIHAMGGTLAEVGAPLAAGFLLVFFDWRMTLKLSVIPAILMGLIFVFYARKIPRASVASISRTELGEIGRHWLKPAGLALIFMIVSYNMALIALMSMTPLFLQTELGYSSAAAGIIFAMAMLGGSLLQPIGGRISDTTNRHSVFLFGSVCAIFLCLVAAFAETKWLIVMSLVAAMSALMSVRSGVLASAVDYAGTRAATTLGFVFALLDGMGALGAVLGGIVGEFNLKWVFGLSAGLSLLSIASAMFNVKDTYIN